MRIRFTCAGKTIAELESDHAPERGQTVEVGDDAPGCSPGRYVVDGEASFLVCHRFEEQSRVVMLVPVRPIVEAPPRLVMEGTPNE